jgi:hypothetical protein
VTKPRGFAPTVIVSDKLGSYVAAFPRSRP